MTIYALHGFLGREKDWKCFVSDRDIRTVNLYENPAQPMGEKGSILMGYSLGGRVAIADLCLNPDRYKAAIIISANPGLSSQGDKEKRIDYDEGWAKRFESEELWSDLMRDWNGQGVLANTTIIERRECDYDRTKLASVMRNWSLGRQEDLANKIEQLDIPILWIAGENDVKFSMIARSLTFYHPLSECWIVPDAGHRVPWEKKEEFTKHVENFLSALGFVSNP